MRDLRGFDRLELPRNNRNIIATSKWLVQGWRANCDIQVLLYECDPINPNPDEIARVTDYIVAYACKGNETIVEEMKQMKALILGSQEVSGTTSDVKRIARKLLNKTIKNKIISKQECMCHLAKLNLFLCSESIQTVSLSGEYRLCTSKEAQSSFLTKYAKRDAKWNAKSLHQYFDHIKNSASQKSSANRKYIIPHYVGARSTPTYPVTEGYAKAVLLMHQPWRNTFDDPGTSKNYIEEFNVFLKSDLCPLGVKIGYDRAKIRYEENTKFVEPTGKNETTCYESFSTYFDESIEEIVDLASTLGLTCVPNVSEENEYFYGDESTDWSKQHYKV